MLLNSEMVFAHSVCSVTLHLQHSGALHTDFLFLFKSFFLWAFQIGALDFLLAVFRFCVWEVQNGALQGRGSWFSPLANHVGNSSSLILVFRWAPLDAADRQCNYLAQHKSF